jgi:hypothetical protein
MAPGPHVDIFKDRLSLDTEADEEEEENATWDAIELGSRRTRYYESQKALGFLFRAIDESHFFRAMRSNDQLTISSDREMMDKLWGFLKYDSQGIQYENHVELARIIRKDYEEKLIKALHTYAPGPGSPLTEHEMLSGVILGRTEGIANRRVRDLSRTMRERFEELMQSTSSCVIKGYWDEDYLGSENIDDRDTEALPRALACLAIGMDEDGTWDKAVGEVKSWKYIAAGIVLREMSRFASH